MAAGRPRECSSEQAQFEHAGRVEVVDQPGDRVDVRLVREEAVAARALA